MNRISDNIRFLRKTAGFNQSEIAEILGFKRSTYATFENGRAKPTVENLMKISNYYGISVDDIINVDLANMQLPDIKKSNLYIYKKSLEKRKGISADEHSDVEKNRPSENVRGMSGITDPYMKYDPPAGYVPKLSLEELMSEVVKARDEFNEAIEQIKQHSDSERAESFKAAFEAEKRNRELLEEKIKLLEEQRMMRDQKRKGK